MLSDEERRRLIAAKTDEALIAAYVAEHVGQAARRGLAEELRRRGLPLPEIAPRSGDTQDLGAASAEALAAGPTVRVGGIGRMPSAAARPPWYLIVLCVANVLLDVAWLIANVSVLRSLGPRLSSSGRDLIALLIGALTIDAFLKASLIGGFPWARTACLWIGPIDMLIGLLAGNAERQVPRLIVYLLFAFMLTRRRVVDYFYADRRFEPRR